MGYRLKTYKSKAELERSVGDPSSPDLIQDTAFIMHPVEAVAVSRRLLRKNPVLVIERVGQDFDRKYSA